ncbi:MAG: MaoC family dehydratase [Gemmatimonadaceae bacterium]|nr:MaoC family dehydratase [Gemmatimonadaceae bacterium]
MPLAEFAVGQSAELTRTLTDADVMAFAALTGDCNPVHVDAVAAAASPFGERIVHGMLTASLLSTLLAMQLPGPGAIYVSQSVRFLRPVTLGETVTARVEITAIDATKLRLTLATTIRNARGKSVIDGEAVVQLPT